MGGRLGDKGVVKHKKEEIYMWMEKEEGKEPWLRGLKKKVTFRNEKQRDGWISGMGIMG